eukprot:374019_1
MCTLSKAQTMGTEKPTFSSIPIIFTLLFCAVTLVNAEIHMITKPIIATSANIRTTAPFIDIINKNIQPPQSVSIIEYRNKHAIGAGKIDLSSPNIYEEITCKKSFIINELFNGKTNHQIVFNVIIIKMLHCIGKSINIIPMMDKYLINQNGGNNVSDTLFVPITFVGLRRF